MENLIKVATDFSMSPGARYRTDGKFSGEEFYESKLKPFFKKAIDNGAILTVDLDGTYGYATSFLSEAFTRLVNDFDAEQVWSNINIISKEEPYLVDEIKEYIFDVQKVH